LGKKLRREYGILFAVLMGTSIVLIRLSIASNPAEAGKWPVEGQRRLTKGVSVLFPDFGRKSDKDHQLRIGAGINECS